MSSSGKSTASNTTRRRRGLRVEFVAVITTVLGLLFAAVATYLSYSAHNNLLTNINQQSKAFAALATQPIGSSFATYEDSGGIQIERQVESYTDLDPSVSDVSIVKVDGTVAFSTSGKKISITAADASTFTTLYRTAPDGSYTRIIVPYFDGYGQHAYVVVYNFSSALLQATTTRQVLSIVIVCLLGLGLSAALAYSLLSHLFLKPLLRLREVALMISAGKYDTVIPVTRDDEIGDVFESVNDMAQTLQADIKKLQEVDTLKTEFIIISSHNMRTPLTTIRGYLDLMREAEISSENKQMLQAVTGASDELRSFVEDMLNITTLEADGHKAVLTPQAIAEPIHVAANDAAIICRNKGVNFESLIHLTNQQALLDGRQFSTALRNVIDNAVKFTPAGGKITLSATATLHHVLIAIQDTGAGIAPEELPKLFTKFHRGTSVMQYDYDGQGIGLYLTKLIIDQHQGTIQVLSTPGQGTTVTIQLPLTA